MPKSGTQAHTEQPSEYRNDICEASYLAGLTDLRAQLASSLILSPVDLAGEIEEGEYLCIWEAVHSKLGLNADVFPSKLVDAPRAHGVKILRAYGPLPEPGKE